MKKDDIIKIQVKGTFRACPNCEYRDGFHAMFDQIESSEQGEYRWLLICPSCHEVFDIGLQARLA